MSDFLSNLHSSVHESWNDFLTENRIRTIEDVERQVQGGATKYTPDKSRVLHFLSNDLAGIKVLILGQDPYPQAGVATGRAFEVGTLQEWDVPYKNVSLKNIVRAIYAAYEREFLTYNEIKQKMRADLFGSSFSLLSPQEIFKSWEQQGVLLLNTSFTCEIGKPGSQSAYWSGFTKDLLTYINERQPDVIWFLWGNHAKNSTSHLQLKQAYKSNHPMICKPGDSDFLFGKVNPFAETLNLINWKG